jgi:16S rRNA (cytosine967-C5)-methyltransferase
MNIRKLALEAIERILNKGGYSNIVINEYLTKYELSPEEKALFTKLVMGTVESKLTLEFYLEPYLRKKQKPWIHNLLLMSVYQLVYLNIPEYAIVNESVNIANLKDRLLGSFVNAVLRNFLRNNIRSMDTLDDIQGLSIKYSYPSWLVAYLLKDYSYEEVTKIFEVNALVKKTAIRVNTLKASLDEVKAELEKSEISFSTSPLVTDGLIVEKNVINHPLFTSGKITIQDIASQLTSVVLNPHEGSLILDLCSAPGGKAAHLAGIMNNTGEIYACDVFEHKLKLMKRNFKRLGVTNVNLQLIDARKVQEHVKAEAFDYVLADLPCSGLGVLGHKVDLKYHLTLDSINEIIELQKEILENTYMLVKKGGYYLISTCTINKSENEEQVANFLKNHPDFEKVEEKTILPFMYDTDGFYICKMRRN